MLDILITNGAILDGTGTPPVRADVGVSQGRIAGLAMGIEQEAVSTIDASGLHVAPGFIDPHTHSELTLLANPMAESKIRQGVTTEIVGNCGGSPGPLLGAAMGEEQAGAEIFGVDVDWTNLGGYLDRVRRQGSAVNVVTLVGHNTIRGAVLGFDDVQPTPAQQAEMEHLVAEGTALMEAVDGLTARSTEESFAVVDQIIEQSMVISTVPLDMIPLPVSLYPDMGFEASSQDVNGVTTLNCELDAQSGHTQYHSSHMASSLGIPSYRIAAAHSPESCS